MFWSKSESETPKPKKEPETITFYYSDDLLARSKKLVRYLGFTGAVGDYVLAVHKVLEVYQSLDKEQAAKSRPRKMPAKIQRLKIRNHSPAK